MSKQQKNNKSQRKTYYHLIPLILALAVIPLVSQLAVYNNNLKEFVWFSEVEYLVDVFLIHKSRLFTLLAACMALLIVGKLFMSEKRPHTPAAFLALGIYAVLAFLSSMLSPYRELAMYGSFAQFETIWVLLGYCVTSYYAYLYISDEKDIRILMGCFKAGILIMVLIGLSQAFGLDFFKSELGRIILAPNPEVRDTLDFNFEVGRVYMTLDNPNYVGPQIQRDYAYHQGTAWPWLMGFYMEAYLRIYKMSGISFVERYLIGFEDEMTSHCIGSLPELFDGNPPFRGRGAISFAMNVAEILRILKLLSKYNL